MSISAETRRQLALLARRPRSRKTEFSPRAPTKWQPQQVRNPEEPEGGFSPYFTDGAAWELIADKLGAGHDVEVVELRKPPGAKGYVMKICLGPNEPLLYVKLQLGSGKVFGRSFHYTDRS